MSCGATTSTSMRVPCGYRFRPTDKELLKYLQRKIDNLPLPCDLIKEVEVYKFDPSELLAQFGSRGEEKCYFFTSTYRKYRKGIRPSRSTKKGYWKASTGETEIKEGNNVIGTTRSLVFYYGEHPREKKTNWIMHEYRLNDHQSVKHAQFPTDPMQLDKWVICSIYENLSASKRENKKRKAIVLSEGLDTTSKKRDIVLQQGPLNGYQENDLSTVPLFDNLPEERTPYDQSIVFYEGLNTEGKKREIISQQIPLNGNQENDHSIAPLFDNLVEEHILIASDMGCDIASLSDIDLARELIPNASNTGCDVTPLSYINLAKELIPNASNTNCDIALSDAYLANFAEFIEMLDREPTNSFDNLPEELIPNASDMGCDIAPPSDTGIANFAELKEMLKQETINYYYPSSSSSS